MTKRKPIMQAVEGECVKCGSWVSNRPYHYHIDGLCISCELKEAKKARQKYYKEMTPQKLKMLLSNGAVCLCGRGESCEICASPADKKCCGCGAETRLTYNKLSICDECYKKAKNA